MYLLVKEALEAGALGFQHHEHSSIRRSMAVTYQVHSLSSELFGIGKALRDTGRGIFQLSAEHLEVA